MQYAMIIDKRRCYGCHGCTVACKLSNATPPKTFWAKVITEEHGKFPNSSISFMPKLCNHCDDAPCVAVCPTGASKKMKDGTVQIDEKTCIGCQLCMDACPYDARYFNDKDTPPYWETGEKDLYEEQTSSRHLPDVVTKCTFCADRRKAGQEPACVHTCPAVARYFGDLDDPNSEVSQLFKKYNPKPDTPENGTKPRVFYID